MSDRLKSKEKHPQGSKWLPMALLLPPGNTTIKISLSFGEYNLKWINITCSI